MAHVVRTAVFAAALGLIATTWMAPPAVAKVSKGDRAAELGGVRDRKNRKIRLRDYRGKVVVLTFGASWCKPCGKELPAYEKLARKFKKRGANVAFVAVNIDKDRHNADAFIKASGLSAVRVGYDPNGNAVETYAPDTMPTTYIIGPKGIVRHVHAGYESGDERDVEAKVQALLSR